MPVLVIYKKKTVIKQQLIGEKIELFITSQDKILLKKKWNPNYKMKNQLKIHY